MEKRTEGFRVLDQSELDLIAGGLSTIGKGMTTNEQQKPGPGGNQDGWSVQWGPDASGTGVQATLTDSQAGDLASFSIDQSMSGGGFTFTASGSNGVDSGSMSVNLSSGQMGASFSHDFGSFSLTISLSAGPTQTTGKVTVTVGL